MQVITLPVPDELLNIANNVNECELLKDYIVDISSIKYDDPELESNKVECSLIYFRNIDLPLPCDFSKLSYKEKEEWILKYINADLYDLSIKELNETILNILSDEPIITIDCILSTDELIKFKTDNKELIDKLIQFIVSLDIILPYAISNIDRENFFDTEIYIDLPENEEKPLFFETIHQLLKYYPIIFDAIHIYYSDKVERIKYTYILHNIEKNSALYLDFLQLPSVKMLGLILNDKDKKDE